MNDSSSSTSRPIRHCPACERGVRVSDRYCPRCGQQLFNDDPDQPAAVAAPKSRLLAALLAFFLGAFGIHNYYLGRNTRAGAQLLVTLLGSWLTHGLAWRVVLVSAWLEGWLILLQDPDYAHDGQGQPLTD